LTRGAVAGFLAGVVFIALTSWFVGGHGILPGDGHVAARWRT
jgi:hypothetical protein